MSNGPLSSRSETLRAAVVTRLDKRNRTRGELLLPCVPSMADEYLARLDALFASLGKRFSAAELDKLREHFVPRLERGFQESPHAHVRVSWESEAPPGTAVDYTVSLEVGTMTDQYEYWVQTKKPPLFGPHPDSRLLDAAASFGDAASAPVLDIGAGTGRNAIPLAQRGHPVTALEATAGFVTVLLETAMNAGVDLRAVEGNVLAADVDVGGPYALTFASEVVSHFRGVADLRTLFERAAAWTREGGLFVLNAFVAEPGWRPPPLVREAAQVQWSTFYTRADVDEAAWGLPLLLVDDQDAYEYEKAHLPPDSWPPTGWYESWSRGWDLFGLEEGEGEPPIRLRWLTWRRM